MEEYEIDLNELEQQRYDKIKAEGKYLELTVLIDTKKETFNGRTR